MIKIMIINIFETIVTTSCESPMASTKFFTLFSVNVHCQMFHEVRTRIDQDQSTTWYFFTSKFSVILRHPSCDYRTGNSAQNC